MLGSANGRRRGRRIHQGHGLARWVGRRCIVSCHSSPSTVAAAASARTEPTAVTNAPRWAPWTPSAFVVYPRNVSRGFGEGAFAIVRRAVQMSAVFTVTTFNHQRVSGGTCSASAVGCGLLRMEHVRTRHNKAPRPRARMCIGKARRGEVRRGVGLRCARKSHVLFFW